MVVTRKTSPRSQHAPSGSRRRPVEKSRRPPAPSRQLSAHASRRTVRARQRSRVRSTAEARRKLSSRGRIPLDGNGHQNRRIVLLDACNVGYFYTNHRGFGVNGLAIALKFFWDRGYEAYGMLPKFRLKPGKSNDPGLLNQLYRKDCLITTPCKEFPSRGMCYDDRFMLEIAARFNCAICSNDQYRDIMHERPGWVEFVRARRIPFQWNSNTFTIGNESALQ